MHALNQFTVPVRELKRPLRRAWLARTRKSARAYLMNRIGVPAISGAASDPQVIDASGIVTNLTAGSTDLKEGDFVYFDGTDWELADNDDHTKYAQLVVISNVKSGKLFAGARNGIIYDADAPYTQGGAVYVTAPAGSPSSANFTQTRPSTAGNLVQVVGYAVSTSKFVFNIAVPREQTMHFPLIRATSAAASLDSGIFSAIATLDAQNETGDFIFSIPENAISIAAAWVLLSAEASAGTPTFAVTTNTGLNNTQWDAVTADTSLSGVAFEGTSADDLARKDVTGGMDATNIFKSSAIGAMRITKDDAGTDISLLWGLQIVFRVV